MALKKIVLLTDCLADLAGGAEKQIYELAKGLDKNKYEVVVVSLDCCGQASNELIESAGSRLHVFRVRRIYGISGLVQGLLFFQFLKKHRIDILLTYHFSSDLWGTFWGHLAGIKTIISNRRDMGFWRNQWHVAAYRIINPWVNKIVAVSQSIKGLIMEQEGVPFHKIEVIYNGVRLPQTAASPSPIHPADLEFGPDHSVIMHVANLKPVKGHVYLLMAFAGVIEKFPNARLVLAGKDEFNGQVQRLAQFLKLQNHIVFLGKREDIPALLSRADIGVLPSLSEGMSNAILEYMAASKAVVATGVGGNPELVKHGFNGLLVKKENVQELKTALLTLIQDQQTRLSMGKNGFSMVQNEFSMAAMIDSYDRLFTNIKVLHLISSGGLFGAERVVLNLSAQNNGVTSVVGALRNEHNPHLEVIDQANRLGLQNAVFNSRGRFDLKTIALVRNFIINRGIDIVHTHNYKSDIIGFWAALLTGRKWIATNHVWHSTDKKLRLYEHVDAFVLRFAHKVVSVSREIKRNLLRMNFKEHQLEVIDNGIPIEQFSFSSNREELRRELGIRPLDCAVAIIGRLAKEKGHKVFLKAAVSVLKKTRDVKFVIVGDGPLWKELKSEVERLDLSAHVVFTGIRRDMADVYKLCDIMVNSSYIEGLPMTILEAMASRLPVIATKVGAVEDVIKHQKNGLLIEPGNADALANAILELMNNEQKRRELAEKSYQEVCSRFSDTHMAGRYRQVYAEVV